MPLSEADTRAKLIDPAIYKRGWTEDHIKREETAGSIEIIGGKARRRARGRVDYVLRVRVNPTAQPVAVALIEAKKDSLPPGHGLDQAKGYAACKRLNVPCVFSSNGYQFVMFDRRTGLTAAPKLMTEFPSPDDLRALYEQAVGFNLEAEAARSLLQPYTGGEASRRYYQDAAIRAVMEKLAASEMRGEPGRALLSLATGAGKTFIAVNLLKRMADAGQMKRALFVCDRDELRRQALGAFQNVFGSDAAEVFRNADGQNNARNARIHIATYQTLGVEDEGGEASFLTEFYPPDYFTHVIIDECHRSAWGKWSQVLTRNAKAAHVGLTATPRQFRVPDTEEARQDEAITANNVAYFGEPVYEYDLAQAIEDGYLAACEIVKGRVNLDDTGITMEQVIARNPTDARTGQPMTHEAVQTYYTRQQYEDRILLPDRVYAMCADLFSYLLETGGPEQKTIIFCARDRHADDVATQMNNLYAAWCTKHGRERLEPYAFKCTAASNGNDQLPDLRGASRSHFIATTVELLTTGVDVPCLNNIVFFKYLKSPISFYQMVGRGTRIDLPSNKLMFRVYDYTDATRLFGEEFIGAQPRPATDSPDTDFDDDDVEPPPPPQVITVEGFDVQITEAGRFIVTDVDGKALPVPVEEYKARLAARLLEHTHTLAEFRALWVDPPARRELLDLLVRAGYSPDVVRLVERQNDYDLYDVLADLGWGLRPRTRQDRADAFWYKNEDWVDAMPPTARATLKAVVAQFARGGTDELENRHIWQTPEVKAAGGLPALAALGNAAAALSETKVRMFAA